ncbi:MAG: hypothetical protein IJN85_05100, partial [Oscillospiraceae bacterium]|nr:hypothetical protein [Oscillospiraceae bacterium]
LFFFSKKLPFPGITLVCIISDANLRVPCFFRCLIFKVRVRFFSGFFDSSELPFPQGARLYYQIIASLSTPFLKLFYLFLLFYYLPGRFKN